MNCGMGPHLFFALIFLYLQVFLANCLREDGFINNSTSVETNTLDSTEPYFKPACPSNRCLRKCCKATEIYDLMNKTCLPDQDDELQNANWSAKFAQFEFIYNSRCPQTTVPLNKSEELDKYQLFSNGSIYALEKLISFDQYCMDYLPKDGTISPLVCYEEVFGADVDYVMESESLTFILYSSGLGISVLFLTITFGLYLATPRLRIKVHDKCFVCHLFTLIIGFSSLIGIQNITPQNFPCAFLGYMVQFWMLASFFWLNIMCIDMWRTVGVMPTPKEKNARKLLVYCLYAWGFPSLILTFSLLVDNFLPSNHPLRTGFGEDTCWFRSNEGSAYSWLDPRYVHFYGVVSFTLLVNIFTFVQTALMIKAHNKLWQGDKSTDSKRHKSPDTRIILYLKLFIVMGLYWMVEVLSYHADSKNAFWVTVDFINTLQGVFVFIIFICNKRALMILNKRFFPRKVFLEQYNRTFSSRNRSNCSKTSKMSITEEMTITSNSLGRTDAGRILNDLSSVSPS